MNNLNKIPIGKIIKEVAEGQGVSVTTLSKKMDTSASNIYDLYRRDTISVDKLCVLSEFLKFNFFTYYIDREPLKSMFGTEIRDLTAQVDELRHELSAKEEMISDKKDIIFYLNEKVARYETKLYPNGKNAAPVKEEVIEVPIVHFEIPVKSPKVTKKAKAAKPKKAPTKSGRASR